MKNKKVLLVGITVAIVCLLTTTMIYAMFLQSTLEKGKFKVERLKFTQLRMTDSRMKILRR